VRKKYNTPAKARQFLVKVGILEKHAGSKNGVRLAKPYRD
jgi:DNA-binding IscR family transcriptional regulator